MTRSQRLGLFAVGIAFVTLSWCSRHGREQTSRFAGRDGQTDALADLAAGHRPKIYAASFQGAILENIAPGIEKCEPAPGKEIEVQFIPELSFHEAGTPTPKPLPATPELLTYVTAYNVTVFKERSAAIRRICPQATLHQIPNRIDSR